MTKILFKLVEEKANKKYCVICLLKKATVKFSGSMKVKLNKNNSPDTVCSFLKWLLSGHRELKEELDIKLKVQ